MANGFARRVSLIFPALFVASGGLSFAFAQADSAPSVWVVTAPTASVYSEPTDDARAAGRVQKGRLLRSNGERRGSFIGLSTKSGQKLWIREADARPSQPVSDRSVEDDLERAPLRPIERGSRSSGPHIPPRATFDLGASTGSVSARGTSFSYTEINLGLNLFFYDWLDWRNAVYGRLVSGYDNSYGLDTSLRGIASFGNSQLGATAFAGPGWRFPSDEGGTPFIEGGLVFRLPGIALGGGARSFLRSWVNSGQPNEVQYFIILSGGGSL